MYNYLIKCILRSNAFNMKGYKRPGTILCVFILFFSVITGVIVQINERQYRSFFVEKMSYGEEDKIKTQTDEFNIVDKININTAGIKELDLLDGIGEGLAKRIVDYRTKNGKFEVIEDIMRVSGIGKKKFEAIRDNICVE